MNEGGRYDAVAILSRSLVGFVFAAWLPLLLAWILLLRSPASPAPNYEQIRSAIVLGVGAATALLLICALWIWRQGDARRTRMARSIAAIMRHRRLTAPLFLLLIEGNILATLLLRDIAPAITDPFRILLFCWTVAFLVLAVTLHLPTIRSLFARGRDPLALFGLTLGAILLLSLLVALSSRLIASSGIHARLRGSLDYRPLDFIDDGAAPSSPAFWAEQSVMRVRWLPYSYWTVAPFGGRYVNVDEAGRRHTPSHTADPTAARIYFFGGSTLWGEGARDAYTIPAQAAQLLAEREVPAQVENYAQTGYVSWQDLLLYQAQLALGNIPDLAVFYQGFNDVYAAYLQGAAGLTLRENQRVNDVELGRLLRSGQPALLPFEADISDYDWSLVASGGASAREIVDRWLQNRRLIRAAAAEYGSRVLFVWQPALFAKSKRSAAETRIFSEVERGQPGFISLYQEAVKLLRERVAVEAADDIALLTDLFSDVEQGIFFDRVHISEIGNRQVADALLPEILEALAEA